MVDTYLLPEVHIVITQVPGVDGTASTARLGQIESDLAIVLARPAIEALDDVPDVDVAGATAGQSLIRNAANDGWEPGTPVTGISVKDNTDTGATGVTTIDFIRGLRATEQVPGEVDITIDYGGTGSSANVARADHWHANPLPVFQSFGASGYMSGGTRQVVSRSVTLNNGVSYNVIARFRPQMRGADGGAAYYTMTLDIGGTSKTSTGGASSGFWCVQGVPNKEEWVFARNIVGTGASVTVSGSVSYHSGSGFNVDAGELEIDLRPNR